MYGVIKFKSAVELAKFLKEFVGSTAKFVVKNYDEEYELEFLGGY